MNIVAGFNLIANQLVQGGNTLNEIMTNVPDGCVLSKYDNRQAAWFQSIYSAATGEWSPGDIVLGPGDGAFLQSPTSFILTFAGTLFSPAPPPAIPTNTAFLVSAQTPARASYENLTGSSPLDGSALFQWSVTAQSFLEYDYFGGAWSPNTPAINIGESAWAAPQGGSPQTPPPLSAPVITSEPASLGVALGDPATFTVAASGTGPLFYQWRLNGNNLAGATNSAFSLAAVQANNCGNYDVLVYNALGLVDSAIASLTITNFATLPFADNFAEAGTLGFAASGVGVGGNFGATTEAGEPKPDGITGGASVWVTWQPQFNGLATFTTAGSGFDTLLAVYTGTTPGALTPVAADDDSAGFLNATVTFAVSAGTSYSIQVDGFYGATGSIVLGWSSSSC